MMEVFFAYAMAERWRDRREPRKTRNGWPVGRLVAGFIAAICLTLLALGTALAQGEPGWPPLDPPARYVYPYPGKLEIVRTFPSMVRYWCKRIGGGTDADWPGTVRGCALLWEAENRCTIVVPLWQDAGGPDQARLLRHELAHCNGWRHD